MRSQNLAWRSHALLRARRHAREKPITEAEIAAEVQAVRSERSK